MDITDEVKEVADRAFELLEMKSPHQLAVELVELQHKHNIALSALNKMQDQREQLVAQLKDDSQRDAVAPDGWQLVPVEPTPEMSLNAMMKATIKYRCRDAYCRVYRAMLAAAPKLEGAQ